jgi:hypothetical protein
MKINMQHNQVINDTLKIVNPFINLILKKEKYKHLNLEISIRRAEIEADNIFSKGIQF